MDALFLQNHLVGRKGGERKQLLKSYRTEADARLTAAAASSPRNHYVLLAFLPGNEGPAFSMQLSQNSEKRESWGSFHKIEYWK